MENVLGSAFVKEELELEPNPDVKSTISRVQQPGDFSKALPRNVGEPIKTAGFGLEYDFDPDVIKAAPRTGPPMKSHQERFDPGLADIYASDSDLGGIVKEA